MDISRTDEYDPKKKEALKEFRRILAGVVTDDHTDAILLKYLRAKNFQLRKSEACFRTRLNLSLALDLKNIDVVWHKHEVLENYEFLGELGFAKDGTPIRYVAMGRGDIPGYMLSLDVLEIGRYCASILEYDMKRAKEHSKKLGKEINEVTYILDMEYLGLRQLFTSGLVEMGLDLFRVLQDCYPEIWKRILIVNAPSYFSIAFNLFRPILRHTLLHYIQIASKGETASLLLKYVDEDVLPVFLGGKRVDSKGNPMCSEFIKFGGRIPEKYYKIKCLRPLAVTDPDVNDIWLSPRCCYNHSVIVREGNSILRIEMRSEGGSLMTGVLYRKFGPDPEKPDLPSTDEYLDEYNEKHNVQAIIPTLHVQCHQTPTDNQCLAVFPGIYILNFDNTYNWLTSRRLIFRIRVLPPSSNIF